MALVTLQGETDASADSCSVFPARMLQGLLSFWHCVRGPPTLEMYGLFISFMSSLVSGIPLQQGGHLFSQFMPTCQQSKQRPKELQC